MAEPTLTAPSKTEAVFERAMTYPYAIPARSYVYHNGGCEQVSLKTAFPDVSGLTPVLAVGSNQSPVQLGRKFSGSGWAPIPVSRVALADFDTVYSAHITGYGSIAATLCHAPGVTVNLFVNWLNADHLERMHETELASENYEFGKLKDVDLRAEVGPGLTDVYFYQGRRGAFAHEGEPVPLAEVSAIGRQSSGMTQGQIQDRICSLLTPGKALFDFVCESVAYPKIRQTRTERIGQGSLPFSYGGYVPSAV